MCYPVARIDIAYLSKEFENFRFSHSSDMILIETLVKIVVFEEGGSL